LPKALNLFEIPMVLLLWMLSWGRVDTGAPAQGPRSIPVRLVLFSLVAFGGTLLNLEYFHSPAAVSQYLMLLEGLVLFVALSRLPFTASEVATFNKLLVAVLVFEVGLGLLQLPGRIRAGDSELVHGTFPGNAEQYALFVTLGLFYLIGMSRVRPERAKLYLGLTVVLLTLIISIDNKASWLGLTAACGLALWKARPPLVRYLRRLSPIALVGLAAAGVYLLATRLSDTVGPFSERLSVAWETRSLGRLGKIKAYHDILRSWWSHPHLAFVGSGLGNFYSRSGRQFYASSELQAQINPYANLPQGRPRHDDRTAVYGAYDSMGGLIRATARKPFYANYCAPADEIFPVGSEQVDGPFSAYTGLLGETGLVGALLYLSVWFSIVSEAGRSEVYGRHYPLVITGYGMLIYLLLNSLYGPWLETGRMTTIAMALAAMVAQLQRQEQSAELSGLDYAEAQPAERPVAQPG
jgi:hypothetical protein